MKIKFTISNIRFVENDAVGYIGVVGKIRHKEAVTILKEKNPNANFAGIKYEKEEKELPERLIYEAIKDIPVVDESEKN